MAKANFTKVEEVLSEGLLKIGVNRLLEVTEAAIKGYPTQNSIGFLLASLQFEIKSLKHKGIDPYEKLGISKKDLKHLTENQNNLKQEDLQKIIKFKETLQTLKKELEAKHPQASNDDLVILERRKHINKRFNVNEKWLPLH